LAVVVEAIDRSKASSPNDEKVMMPVAQPKMGKYRVLLTLPRFTAKQSRPFNKAFFNDLHNPCSIRRFGDF
jgi:hypothetical protein